MKPVYGENIFITLVHEGYFSIDKYGQVWRLADRNNPAKYRKILPELAGWKESKGYLVVSTSINDKRYFCKIHRLVWVYFYGPIPIGKEINHINGCRSDNRPENIELVTCSENQKHSYRITKTHKPKWGEANVKAKLKEKDVFAIRKRFRDGERVCNIARDYPFISYYTIWDVTRRTWRHL